MHVIDFNDEDSTPVKTRENTPPTDPNAMYITA